MTYKYNSVIFAVYSVVSIFLMPYSVANANETTSMRPETPKTGVFLDSDWYRRNLIDTVDRWNGGINYEFENLYSSGMGVYLSDFNGFFHVNVDQQWNQVSPAWTRATSVVAHSRAIYMNVEAYRAAGAMKGERFLQAATAGADFLLEHYWDKENGGFYWSVFPSGELSVKNKRTYGIIHPTFVLAQVYSITKDPKYLSSALAALDVISSHFMDPDYPQMIQNWNYSEDFGSGYVSNNIDGNAHYFEALLALFDVTPLGERRNEIADLIEKNGNFITQVAYKDYFDQEKNIVSGYLAYHYDSEWQPSQVEFYPNRQWSTAMHTNTGLGIEWAFLLSRATERGFGTFVESPEKDWMEVANKLVKFCLEYTIDENYGGMRPYITDYQGQNLFYYQDDGSYVEVSSNNSFEWWPQAETSRALLHWVAVHGHEDFSKERNLVKKFKSIENFFTLHQTDLEYGGIYPSVNLDPTDNGLTPNTSYKGNDWKAGYHATMFFSEALRLASYYIPKAHAGSDRAVRIGSLVTLNGEASSDPDNKPEPLSFQWITQEGTGTELNNASKISPSFTPTVIGKYKFQLTVSDGASQSVPNDVEITVPLLGDIDIDGDVDLNDIALILLVKNKKISNPNDLRDINGDMKINNADVRKALRQCSRPKCAL